MRGAKIFNAMRQFAQNQAGSMAIETALVAPMLILIGLGTADVSKIVSRQNELQSGIGQVEAIALAANSGASTDTATLKSILMESLSLPSGKVTVEKLYRCNASEGLVADPSSCSTNDVISSYVRVTLTDSYNPIWQRVSNVGTWDFNVVRTVQLS